MDTLWIALAARMAATAAVVVVACLVVERAGPLLGAMVATLPVSAGPAYAFLAADHGAAFIAAASPASLAALGATAVFVTTYGSVCRTRGRLPSTLAALAAWMSVASLLRTVAPGLWAAAGTDVAIFAVCASLASRWRHAPATHRPGPAPEQPVPLARGRGERRDLDIPVRAGAAMLLVAAVIGAGRLLGPQAAGLLALAPVVMTSLAVLLHPRIGGRAAAAVMANTLPGLLGNAVAVVVLGVTAVPFGATPALLLALSICIGWNAAVLMVVRPRRGPATEAVVSIPPGPAGEARLDNAPHRPVSGGNPGELPK